MTAEYLFKDIKHFLLYLFYFIISPGATIYFKDFISVIYVFYWYHFLN